jgi:hypothetical protein
MTYSRQKALFLFISLLCLSFTIIREDPKDRLNVKGPQRFGKTAFKLAWTDHPKDTYYIQEYLPEGEKVTDFNQMLTLHVFVTDLEVKDAVSQKIKELVKRKETDAMCNYHRDEITPFLSTLGKERTDFLNVMITSEMPLVKIGQ